jgi:Restriction alleviation protein Lar
MSDLPKIERCPFCGGRPISEPVGDGLRGLMIQCLGADCPNPSVSYYDHADAIRVWNRRAPARRSKESTR